MPIHVLLAQMPRMLRDILSSALDAEPDMRVVGDLADDAELARRVAHEQPDVVILASGADAPADGCDALLLRHPRLKVLVLGERGREVSLCELRPTRTPLGEVSPAQLVAAIRHSVRAEHGGHAGAVPPASWRTGPGDA